VKFALRSVAFWVTGLLAMFGMCFDVTADDKRPATGTVIPDLRFKDIRALDRSLMELGEPKACVFVFTTTTCPLVRRSMPKLVGLHQRFGPQGVEFVSVNVGADDTIREIAEQAIEFGAGFPFVKDTNLSCAMALGVTKTPEVAVLDGNRRLVYRGRIDDQLRIGGTRPEPSRKDLEEALTQLLSGVPLTVPETPVDGCEITYPSEEASSKEALPEYHRDIAPLLDRKCNHCHREGTAAPFSLLTLADVRANAAMIGTVEDETMPPWYASAKHGRFQNDPSLTREEKSTLLRSIHSERREGTVPPEPPADQSPAAIKSEAADADGWRIGKPDLVITMLE